MNRLVIIAAAAENNALGINNDLPWHLPDDFKRFKALTSGHKIIMGRKTLESFPKPLPNREHIVVTRDKDYIPKFDCTLFHSLEEALHFAKIDERSFIIGGGEIYRQSMDHATDIELTRIHADFEADTFFPEIDEDIWQLVKEEYYAKDERHKYDFTYLTYTKLHEDYKKSNRL
ncbi:dihydrofolate reductase [Allomuricauda sp. d1]|uniref:dihydrofolate reductase n=1 Tax=Allomuricauda sp. d1 TaxID=3136725 RepID=UPI0031D2B2B3